MGSQFLFLTCIALAKPHPLPKVHRVVIEVDQAAGRTFPKVLATTANLMKAFATDRTEVEIVCRDDGIALLIHPNAGLAASIRALHSKGVRFVACRNTLRGRHFPSKAVTPLAGIVPSGIAEIVLKEEAGWSYLKAGG